MKAIVYEKRNSPNTLVLREIEKPVPGDNEVLARIHAVSVNAGDYRSMRMGSIPKKKIFGADIAGVVEAAGCNVRNLKPGDEVAGDISDCGMGGFAEYVTVPERALASKPADISFEQAAALPMAAVTALQVLRNKGRVKPGHKVLICGAGGGVGTFAVQLAKYFGADVIAVCGPQNIELVKSLGAKRAIDYTKADFTASGEKYDIIFDTVAKSSFSRCKKALTAEGVYLTTVPSAGIMASMLFTSSSKRKAVFAATGLRKPFEKVKDLDLLSTIIEAGKLIAVIGRTFSLEQMAEAHRYVETGHKIGNAAVAVSHI